MKQLDLSARGAIEPTEIDAAIRRAHLLRAEFVRDFAMRLFGGSSSKKQRQSDGGKHYLHHKGAATA